MNMVIHSDSFSIKIPTHPVHGDIRARIKFNPTHIIYGGFTGILEVWTHFSYHCKMLLMMMLTCSVDGDRNFL